MVTFLEWKRFIQIVSFILLSVSCGLAQGSGKADAVLGSNGQPIPFPSVRVCTQLASTQGGSQSTPCQPLDTIYTDSTLLTPAPNPFFGDASGNFTVFATPGWHTIQVCATGVSCYEYQALFAPDVNNMGGIFVGSVSSISCNGSQGSCSPAATGVFRLGPNDSICWRNTANSADVCISKNGADQIVGTTQAATTANSLTSASANPAGSGVIRLASGDTYCFRNAANSSDICVSHNGSDYIVVAGNGLQSAQFQTAAANPAQSGVVRLASGDSICFRNTANTADVCISKNGSDQIVGVSGSATQVTSASANPAATGVVRLAAGDTVCWRNAGNTADICITKDANDRISFASGSSAANYVSTAANPAASGVIRLAAADTLCFRNAGNTADICMSKNSSDQIVVQLTQALTSASSNPAGAGVVRLATGDSMCFRNNANSGDICIAHNASDQVTFPQGINAAGASSAISSLAIGGDFTFTKSPRFDWASGTSGNLNSTFTFDETVPPVQLSLDRIAAYVGTPATGCTTLAVIDLFDVTSSADILTVSIANSTSLNQNTGGPVDITSGDTIGWKVKTAAAGCTQVPAGLRVTAWFHMK